MLCGLHAYRRGPAAHDARQDWGMSDDEPRLPIASVLAGLEVHPLPANWTPIETFVLIKCLGEDGDSSWSYRTTHRLKREELP